MILFQYYHLIEAAQVSENTCYVIFQKITTYHNVIHDTIYNAYLCQSL